MGRMRGIIEEPTGLRYVPSLFSEDQGRDLLERVRGLEFDEVRMQAAKYCHGSARSNSDRPATLAKSADVAKRGRPSVGGPASGTARCHLFSHAGFVPLLANSIGGGRMRSAEF
jgi:hypothetical protein